MLNPQEIMYWDILPSIRSRIVFEMKHTKGLKQKEIAKLLHLTPSAISQYLQSKRGTYEFTDDFLLKIKDSVEKIINGGDVFEQTTTLLKEFEMDKHLCKICQSKNNISPGCNICFKKIN